jgi:hypothetical protein
VIRYSISLIQHQPGEDGCFWKCNLLGGTVLTGTLDLTSGRTREVRVRLRQPSNK